MLRNAAQRPKNNANPSGLSEQDVYCVEKSAILPVRWKFHCIAKIILALFLQDLVILSLSTLFVGSNQAQKVNWLSRLHAQWYKMHSNSLGPSEKNSFLIRLLSCMHKGQKCIHVLWGHHKKFLSLKTTKNARYVPSIGKIFHFV